MGKKIFDMGKNLPRGKDKTQINTLLQPVPEGFSEPKIKPWALWEISLTYPGMAFKIEEKKADGPPK